MFIGHYGLSFAAKPVAKRVSLGTFFFASQFIDLLWPTLLLLGGETVKITPGATRLTPLEFTSYPISHSLLAVFSWSVLFALAYFVVRHRIAEALLCGLLVTSHWVLDLLVHQPDLQLSPSDSFRVGLGLWNFPLLAIGTEVLIFVAGLLLYLRATSSLDRIGSYGLGSLVALLTCIYFVNIFGPPPPTVGAIAWAGHAQWLLLAWAYWVDRHRKLRNVT